MLSNLIITQQKFVLIIDDVDYQKFSNHFLECWAKEQNEKFEVLDSNSSVLLTGSIDDINLNEKKSILLPSLSSLLIFHKPNRIFQLIHKLKNSSEVKQIFLWATKNHIADKFLIPFFEYQADLIVNLFDDKSLSVLTKKLGGIVTNKKYKYKRTSDSFTVAKDDAVQSEKPIIKTESVVGTFKIELDEDELVARNAIKMPYEKAIDDHQNGEGNIIYVPDASDDFDEEDPDEDLYAV